jgi:hypothetical protein
MIAKLLEVRRVVSQSMRTYIPFILQMLIKLFEMLPQGKSDAFRRFPR